MSKAIDIKSSSQPAGLRKNSNILRLNLPSQKRAIFDFPAFPDILRHGAVFCLIVVLVLGSRSLVFAPGPSFVIAQEDKNAKELERKNKELERENLEAQLRELERQIEEYQQGILKAQKEARSLKREIKILEQKIAKLNLQIKATNLSLDKLDYELMVIEEDIGLKQLSIQQEKTLLASVLQNLYERESQSLLEMLLKNRQLSDFFDELNSLENLQIASQESLTKLYQLKEELEKQKEDLLTKKADKTTLINIQKIQKRALASNQKEKSRLLEITKGKEVEYQKLKKEAEKTAAEILNKLYRLAGIGKPIKYDQALKFAKFAGSATGVRPALILAIITMESTKSELGDYVGSCNRPGDPPQKSWRKVMKPGQQKAFQEIIAELNAAGMKFNIDEVPISCPQYYGAYAGALGPAQFMPLTWQAYKSRIASITGHSPPNPWDPLDAFVAASLYLRDAQNKWGTEYKAAKAYLCGNPNRYTCPSWYGTGTLRLAECHQEFIDTNSMSPECERLIFE